MKELLLGWRVRVLAALCLGLAALSGSAWSAEAAAVSEFAWRGSLTLPAQASLVRVEVPVAALLRMQSSAGHDLRVFNAAGDIVPFALLGRAELSHVAPVVRTASYPAYTLFSAVSAGKPSRGAVEVQVNTNGQNSSAWVRLDPSDVAASAPSPGTQPLQAALFDLRAEQQAVDALELSIDLPRNALVPISLASSENLKDWTVVGTKSPLFQFDGDGAPSNHTLELQQPLPLKGRYLRLSWPGQTGVVLRTLVGRVATAKTTPAPLCAALPPGTLDPKGGLTWTLPFATPLAAVHLQAMQDNTLVPVRIQGRGDAAQPWRTLASAVVYRLDTVGQGSSNPSTPLHGASVRALRVEASQGAALPSGGLRATVEFAPLQLAFLTSGAGPFTLAVGRSHTSAASVDATLLGSLAPDRLNTLPLATLARVEESPPGVLAGAAPDWLPAGTTLRSVLLWLVLGLGVLVLAAVAFSLMRQLAARR
jgi:hypothetical protein